MIKKIAAFLTAVFLTTALTVPSAEALEWYEMINDSNYDDEESISIDEDISYKSEIDISYFDLGGAVFISYNYVGGEYVTSASYKKDGVTHIVNAQGKGFVYVRGLKKGKNCRADISWSDGEKSFKKEFTIKTGKNTKNVLSLKKHGVDYISLSWQDFAPGQTYSVYRKQNKKWKKIGETKNNSYTDKGLNSGSKYSYRLAVKGISGDVDIKETEAVFNTLRSTDNAENKRTTAVRNENDITEKAVLSENLPECPQELTAVNTGNGIKLSWLPSAEGAKYGVYTSSSEKGRYKLVNTTDKTECLLDMEAGNKPRYFKVMYIKGSYRSGFSNICKVYPPVTKKVVFGTSVMSAASWGSKNTGQAKKGQTAEIFGESGNFYLCKVNGKTGYIYKRAIDGGNAPSDTAANEKNLALYLDDILFRTGTSPKAIWDYVNSFKYNAARTNRNITDINSLVKNRDNLSADMIKYRSGICYHYAALSAKLLNRAGYKVKLVYCPHTGNGFHCYNIVEINGTWKYFDACRHAYSNEMGYLPERSAFMRLRKLAADKEQVSDITD